MATATMFIPVSLGCGSPDTGTGGTEQTTVATSSTGAANCSGFGDGSVCMPAMNYGGGEVPTPTQSVKARIVDQTGAPVADQPVFICGLDTCSLPGKTSSDGTVFLSTTIAMMTKPAFKFGDQVSYSELAIPMTTPIMDFTTQGTGVLATAHLTTTPGASLEPGGNAVSGPVTVSVPAGASVVFDGLVYDTCESQLLQAARVPMTNLGPVLDPVTVNGAPGDFGALYGVRPVRTTFCPAAKVTVALPSDTMTPNDLGWVAGTAVEFWVTTIDTAQDYAPYGGWAKMSDGVVAADGTTASTNDGAGFVYLDNFAIRRKSP